MTYSEFGSYLFWYSIIAAVLLGILLVAAAVRGYRSTERKRLKILQIAAVSVIWITATAFAQFVDAFFIISNTARIESRSEVVTVNYNESFRGLIIYQVIWILLSLALAYFLYRKPKSKLN